ncbi:MAG: Holliday junction branch migration protein RuvA [Intestinibaculum porci]|uniref:Holliday junction branch migration protein RuvA n=1 Tax=Intestinibaculum porci TaxID=2487118 RepID=UPI003F0F0C5C
MYNYIKGIITEFYSDHIVLENNGIGYLIYVPNPYVYKKKEEVTVYVFQSITENDMRLYGFRSAKEKDLFLMLIKVKGIGPKSAIVILASGEVNDIINAIENDNTKYLKSFPGIGPKAASQIILDLKGKFDGLTRLEAMPVDNPAYEEACEVLVALGYKEKDVDKVMGSLKDEDLDTNGYVKKALALMVK